MFGDTLLELHRQEFWKAWRAARDAGLPAEVLKSLELYPRSLEAKIAYEPLIPEEKCKWAYWHDGLVRLLKANGALPATVARTGKGNYKIEYYTLSP